jgi:signal transduction histidine kinase
MKPQFPSGKRSRGRLLLGLGAIAGLFLGEGALGSLLSRRFNADARHSYEVSLASVEQVTRIARDVDTKRILADEFVLEHDPAAMSAVERQLADVCADLRQAEAAYDPLIDLPNEATLSRRARSLDINLDRGIQDVLAIYRDKGSVEARARLSAVQQDYEQLDRTLATLVQMNLGGAAEAMHRIGELQRRTEIAEWATRIAGLFALLLFGFWGARRIVRYEDQITGYAREIEERNRDLDSFAGRVAHDLRNALGPIVMSPHMLRQASEPTGRIAAIADRIERCSDRAIAIVNALLSFSRASQKAEANESAPLEVAVKDVREELAPLVAQLDVSVEVGNIPKVHLRCSPGLLHIVLANLCGNAVKYLQGQPERHVRLSAQTEGELCRIEVEDTGPGIAREEQARIFEPFFRGQGTRAQGTGIGLATVRRIVDARAGRIALQSDAGQGSRFIVWLPLAPAPG